MLKPLAVVALALVLAACQPAGESTPAAPKVTFNAVDITGAEYGRKLDLPDADGRMRSLADWKGKVAIVFFGYTQCPDVCPTTLAEIAALKRQLGADGDKVQAVFVTLDPERDSPELLKGYMANFGPGFVALRGTPAQTQAAALEFKVFYSKVPGKVENHYTIDHTAGAYVIDPQGRLRLFVRYGGGLDKLGADVKALLAGA
ncbi:MAG: SCO family protein [Proteobacteria bacterium]|nr:SCO family protein [Pseudomonadota bacterium]